MSLKSVLLPPNLETVLVKFNREHWHDEDEVRFSIHGRGLFHIHSPTGPLVVVEVEAGDLICVPQRHLALLRFVRRTAESVRFPYSRALPAGQRTIPTGESIATASRLSWASVYSPRWSYPGLSEVLLDETVRVILLDVEVIATALELPDSIAVVWRTGFISV